MITDNSWIYQKIQDHLHASAAVKHAIAAAADGGVFAASAAAPAGPPATVAAIARAAEIIAHAFRNGGKLLLCGNGGSAADCQHMAAEFTNILDRSFERPPLPAISLATDTSFLTAFSNDAKRFAEIFSRQVEAIGRRGDVLIGISTSGTSENVIRALETAKRMSIATIALTGRRGPLASVADLVIAVPSERTSHIQEAHLAVEHVICELVECFLYPERRGVLPQTAADDRLV
ncbi:MAG: SIS domain-containing protein [Candidatus Sungbacteria bacterium]|uniref:SIS domain-containing protein n=1 Tax=Candidatus Sungiibacteriota bacterium TaxID=2750080 RepID=A0A932YY35_9BACT|nr:SIS domain-containing protein [Candidatus Sungbacteria bacterium]